MAYIHFCSILHKDTILLFNGVEKWDYYYLFLLAKRSFSLKDRITCSTYSEYAFKLIPLAPAVFSKIISLDLKPHPITPHTIKDERPDR